MTTKQCLRVVLLATVVLTALAGVTGAASAQSGTPEQIRERIQDRIRTAQNLTEAERTAMQENLEVCLRSGVGDPALDRVFPGGAARAISAQTMLQLQARVRVTAQDGLPAEAVLAKVQEALMKGVPESGLAGVCERVEQQLRASKRIMTQAREDGVQAAPNAQRERQLIREMAQQMWRGTNPAEVDELRARARERVRTRSCSMEDLVAASETATRLREDGVEARRALRVTGEALGQGYGAREMRQLQYMMVYRHRENRAVKGLVDDLEHCLGQNMDAGHMYQYMMQRGWMGPGDVQGPGGSRPIDDQGRGSGTPGGGTGGRGAGGSGSGGGGTGPGKPPVGR